MKFRSYYFILAYIGSVFLFAGVYSTMPYEFYHSTVKYEKVLNNDIVNIRNNITEVLKEHLKQSYQSDTVTIGKNSLKINTLRIWDIEIKGRNAKFLLVGDYFSSNLQIFNGEYLTLYFGSGGGRGDTMQNGQLQYVTMICCNDTSDRFEGDMKIRDLFTLKNIKRGKGGPDSGGYNCPECIDCGTTMLPDSLGQKLVAYSNALEGFPSYSSGNFERMFYLSAVTITTVGYGDIVPITPKARLLISIEAIWGIILIGLFLNSLANRVFRNKKDETL